MNDKQIFVDTNILWSENFGTHRDYEGVRIVNPLTRAE